MLLDGFEHIDKSNLGCERVAMVDVRVTARSIPAVYWHTMRQHTQQNPLHHHET